VNGRGVTAADVLGELARLRVIPVVVLDDLGDAAPLAEVLSAAGLRCAEVTLRTEAGEAAIAVMAQWPDLLVGAGTVLDASQVGRVTAAGARFVVSPGFDDEVIEACGKLGVLALPGAVTPTEIQRARRAGLAAVKFFPAEALGGIGVIDAMSAPFPDMRFVPTGGITPASLQPYLAHEAVLAVGGSWMVPRRLLAGGQWDQLSGLAAEAARLASPVPAPADPRSQASR
jgi:2-dehydro-3-deoxyphosphogluconate aldolase/(4S)-4-hydroxy-2-oxoglutarate aldolase